MKQLVSTLIFLFSINTMAEEPEVVRGPSSYQPPKLTDELQKNDTRDSLPDVSSPTKEDAPSLVPGIGDFKKKLSEEGFDFGLIYKGEFNSVFKGGLQKQSAYLENLDVRLNFDLEKMAGLKGGSFFLYGLGNRGPDAAQSTSANVGDLQGTSNIQTTNSQFILYEAWYQQMFLENKFSILFGLHDLNSEFYSADSAAIFLNSSYGVGKDLSQTGVNGPSIFPVTALSLRLKAEPSEHVYLQTAIFNAQAGDPNAVNETHVRGFGDDGNLLITEAGFLNLTEHNCKLAAGAWAYDRTFEHQEDAAMQVTSKGYYFVGDVSFSEDTGIFLKYGRASTESNTVGASLVAGFQIKNIWGGERQDRLGLGLTKIYLAPEYVRSKEAEGQLMTDSETAFELTYRFDLMPGLVLQPDFQYILNPSGRTDIEDAQVGAIRLEIAL